jgi:uracil-DNA glycosylase
MTTPKSLADSATHAARLAAMVEPHVAALRAFVDQLRSEAPTNVPDFDPLDGGVNAECLFLLETPGRRGADATGFVSRDNADPTARNLANLCQEAGLDRARTVIWNVVPWYIGDSQRNRASTNKEIADCSPHLRALLVQLPHLRAVVLFGKRAQRTANIFGDLPSSPQVFQCPHPSGRSLNARPELRDEIRRCLLSVTEYLDACAKTVANLTVKRDGREAARPLPQRWATRA